MKTSLSILFILLASALAPFVRAQERANDYLQSETPFFELIEGEIPGKHVQMVFEDSEGYLWLATNNGVTRYDGNNYASFYTDHSNDKYVNSVSIIAEDVENNTIWFSLRRQNKLVCLNKHNYSITELPYTVKSHEEKDLPIRSLYSYDDTTLFAVMAVAGPAFVDKRTGEVELLMPSTRISQSLNSPALERDGHIFFALTSGIYRIPTDDKEHVAIECVIPSSEIGTVRHICFDKMGNIIIETRPTATHSRLRLLRYDMATNIVQELFSKEGISAPSALTATADGIWLSTSKGLLFFDYATARLKSFNTRSSRLFDNKITFVCRSKNQPIVWIGSSDGLIKCDYYASKFDIIDMRRFSPSVTANVYMVRRDVCGTTWAWCVGALLKMQPGADNFQHANLTYAGETIDAKSFFFSVEDTARRVLYLSTFQEIYAVDEKTERVTKLIRLNDPERISNVFFHQQQLLICTQKRVIKFNPINHEAASLILPTDLTINMRGSCFDGRNTIWFADNKAGIHSINILNGAIYDAVEVSDVVDRGPLTITCLRYAERNKQQGELWIGTFQKGMYYYSLTEQKLSKIDYSSFIYNEVSSIEVDNRNNVWASSNDGLVCIGADGNVYEYEAELYFPFVEFHNTATSVGADGDVYMGGQNYIIRFNANNFAQNDYFPTPRIASYRYINTIVDSEAKGFRDMAYSNADTIDIPKDINSLGVYVSVANYSQSNLNEIEWRVNNLSETFKRQSVRSPIILSNMPEGLSTLELRSVNSEGLALKDVSYFSINKEVYFYESRVFKVFIALLVVALMISMFQVKSFVEMRRRAILESEVERQAGVIRLKNSELEAQNKVVEEQNELLRNNSVILEQQVKDRTAELEVAMKKAEESSRLKSVFLASLSHEVRTPMNAIIGFTKLIGDEQTTDEERGEFVRMVLESSYALNTLIRDLLDTSRIEVGTVSYSPTKFEVAPFFSDVYKMLTAEKKNAAIDFVLHLEPNVEGLEITTDRDKLRQIVINITYNAFKFTDKGHVKIGVKAIDGSDLVLYHYPESAGGVDGLGSLMLVWIEDTGIGMPPEKLNDIFEPFLKLNNNKTMYPGLGLGLNIVKNFTTQQGGQVWVTSKENVGTTFYFYLPL